MNVVDGEKRDVIAAVAPAEAPLAGKTAYLAASGKLLPQLTAGLRALGCDALAFPVLEAREIANNTELIRAATNLGHYDWVIFTSAYGVEFFARQLRQSGVAAFPPADKSAAGAHGRLKQAAPFRREDGNESVATATVQPGVCAIGPATAAAAARHGLPPTLTAARFEAEGVLLALEEYHGGRENLRDLRVLIPRAAVAREFLPESLVAAGCQVDVVPCYRTVCPEPGAELVARLRGPAPNLIVFTSAAAIDNFLQSAGGVIGAAAARQMLRRAAIAVIGPVTAQALASTGRMADIVPPESTASALIAAIRDYAAALL